MLHQTGQSVRNDEVILRELFRDVLGDCVDTVVITINAHVRRLLDVVQQVLTVAIPAR